MIKYFKSFKEYIPTWVICIFLFFWIFVWTLVIAIVLFIIQCIQVKKFKSKMCASEGENYNDSEIQHFYDEIKKKDNTINELNDSINKYKKECILLENKLKTNENKDIQSNVSLKELEYENSVLKDEITSLNEIIDNQNEEICNLSNEKQGRTEELSELLKSNSELDDIKSELKILNSKLIEKYYIFSNYDYITSQDCKNELILLKQKEKEMRQSGEDVWVQTREDKGWKLEDRTIRQILRNFNSECDNIMSNITIKNIDNERNKIQKSFDTLNKLYSVDGVALSKELLELKLEQITLMYTYELKHEQELEIQKAIKEQMLEEAKAQRELEEQKKKIDKDLQQHVGEVNRLMKYLQKTKIDAEKQLYMDKIKELEDKIKVLESDKETVLEREANARAGFVYIISNIGSFGEGIYKIGMTRRLEPMDRVKELSSASVPFEFDVHAMIFSSDAPELENILHKHFADRAVNKVNPRKEFYKVDIDEIEKIVKENYNDTVQFTKIPIATEYRQSVNM